MIKEITKSTVQKRPAAAAVPFRAPQARPESGSASITQEQRQFMICEAAYYIAEHRGFGPGHDVDDWLEAEQQIDAVLTSSARMVDARLQR